MAAAAFTETLIFRGARSKRVIHVPCSVSDVAAEYAVAPDGNGFIQLPSDDNYALQDAIVITGGTDTNVQDIFANGLATGIRLNNKSNLNTAVNRQFQSAPVVFKAGSLLRFKQAA
jgi:hypothetical protein